MKKNNKMNFYLKAYPGVVATRRIKTGTITTIDFLLFGVFPFGLGGFPSLSFGKLPPEILKIVFIIVPEALAQWYSLLIDSVLICA